MAKQRSLPFAKGKFFVHGIRREFQCAIDELVPFVGRTLPAREAAESILDGVFPPGTVGCLITERGDQAWFEVIAVEIDLLGPRSWSARPVAQPDPRELVARAA